MVKNVKVCNQFNKHIHTHIIMLLQRTLIISKFQTRIYLAHFQMKKFRKVSFHICVLLKIFLSTPYL